MTHMIDYTALTRLIVYALGALAGAVVIVFGAISNDLALIAAGSTLLGTNALAGWNTTPSTDDDDYLPLHGSN